MKYFKLILLGILISILIVIGYWAIYPISSPLWTGFGPYDELVNGPRSKTLWDWLELIVIPFVLSLIAWFLSLSDKKHELERETDAQHQKTLIDFLEKIHELVVTDRLGDSSCTSDINQLARSYILFVFRALDKNRKAEALQIIYEMKLINCMPKIKLHGANLNNSHLESAPLIGVEIKGAYFKNANFKHANLQNSIFLGSNFCNADFRNSNLTNVDFSYSDLTNANFKGCQLSSTIFSYAKTQGAKPRKFFKNLEKGG